MRMLVAYGSNMGGTAGIAELVGNALTDAGFQVGVQPAPEVADLGPYDTVIIGGAIYTGHWHRQARRFVKQHTGALRERPRVAVQQRPAGWLGSRGHPAGAAGTRAAGADRRPRARDLRRPALRRRQGVPGQRHGQDPRRRLAGPRADPGLGG